MEPHSRPAGRDAPLTETASRPGGLLRSARRIAVAVIGGTIVLIGVAMMVLPGPAFIVIPAGLAILATEFVWARRLLRRVRDKAAALASRKPEQR